MTEPLCYIQQQQARESQEAVEDVMDETMREVGDAEDPEDLFYDDERETRKQILNHVMEEHPDMAFTGDSVSHYLDGDGDLESAYEDRHIDPYFDSEY